MLNAIPLFCVYCNENQGAMCDGADNCVEASHLEV